MLYGLPYIISHFPSTAVLIPAVDSHCGDEQPQFLAIHNPRMSNSYRNWTILPQFSAPWNNIFSTKSPKKKHRHFNSCFFHSLEKIGLLPFLGLFTGADGAIETDQRRLQICLVDLAEEAERLLPCAHLLAGTWGCHLRKTHLFFLGFQ